MKFVPKNNPIKLEVGDLIEYFDGREIMRLLVVQDGGSKERFLPLKTMHMKPEYESLNTILEELVERRISFRIIKSENLELREV